MVMRIVAASRGTGQWSPYAKRQRNLGFFAYGHEFLQVALKTGSPLVRAHLLGHALELMLKTYLLTQGWGERKLRTLKHNLARALTESRAAGLDRLVHLSSETESAVRALSGLHASEALRYFSILHLLSPPRLPDLARVLRFARTLDTRLAAHLRAA